MNKANAGNHLPPTRGPWRIRAITQSAAAPDINRIVVKLAASMAVSFSAMRHKIELLANATIATDVSTTIRTLDISILQAASREATA